VVGARGGPCASYPVEPDDDQLIVARDAQAAGAGPFALVSVLVLISQPESERSRLAISSLPQPTRPLRHLSASAPDHGGRFGHHLD
jgi:hypothetical protein